MYAVRCSACGRPGAVALAVDGGRTHDRYPCPACGEVAALEPGVVAQLEAAASVIRQHAAQARQLSAFQRRMATSTRYSSSVFFGSSFLALFPFACLFGIMAFNQDLAAIDFGLLLTCGAPLVIVALVALGGHGQLKERLARVRALSAAIPPPAPGEPARCHVCGGVVTPMEAEAFTRCSFCHSDNLTDPRILAGLAKGREAILENYAARATEETGQVHKALRSARSALIFGSVAAIPLSCVCMCPVIGIMTGIETDPYESIEYTLFDTPNGRCVAELSPNQFDPTRVNVSGDWDEAPGLHDELPRAEVRTFRYDALIGLEVIDHHYPDEDPFVVREVHGTAGTGHNRTSSTQRDGRVTKHSLNDLCLTESAIAPVVPLPLPIPVDPWAEPDAGP